VNPDLSDSEFIEQDVPLDAATPAVSDLGDPGTPAADAGEEEEEEEEEDQDGDIDEELAAELDQALVDEEEDEEDDDSSSSEESEDEDDEQSQAKKLLNEEIRDLEAAVNKKKNEIASSANPLIRVRHRHVVPAPSSLTFHRNDLRMLSRNLLLTLR